MPGYPQRSGMPAPYSLQRRIITAGVVAGDLAEGDLRTAEWAGRSPYLKADTPGYATEAEALDDAVLIMVTIRVDTGVVRYLQQANQSDAVNSATTINPLVKWYRREDEAWRFWYHTDGAAATFEIEIHFDVPRGDD